jgi:hypothetical protein
LVEVSQFGGNMTALTNQNDSDLEKSSKVARELQNALACCKEFYKEKMKHANQLS